MIDVVVREAVPKDVEGILQLREESTLFKSLLCHRMDTDIMLVAEREENIIGFLWAVERENAAYILRLSIRGEHIGRGVGAMLLSRLRECARRRGLKLMRFA